MKEVQVFEANDGKQFPTPEACTAHEEELIFDELLTDESYYNEDANGAIIGDYASFKKFITENREYVLKILGILS